MTRHLGAAALLLCAACASVEPRTAATPGGAAESANPMEGAFAWSAARRLTWADFRGRPDLMSGAVALTTYLVSYDTACDGRRFDPKVVSRFMPRLSWVKSEHLMIRNSLQTLQHEQTHFDLSEVQARRARQALRALENPCDRSDESFEAMFKAFSLSDAEMQQQYDRETVHGTDVRRQREWEARVQAWLQSLASIE